MFGSGMQESFQMEEYLRRWKRQINTPYKKRGQIIASRRKGGHGMTIFGKKHRNSNFRY